MLVGLLLIQIIIPLLCYLSDAQNENDVRLYLPPPDDSNRTRSALLSLFSRSQSVQLGVLQLYRDGEWGTVCDDNWDSLDSQVVCSQLKFPYSSSYSSLPFLRGLDQEAPPDSPIWLDEVRCTGNEATLVECHSLPFGANDCTHKEDVNLLCSSLNLNDIYRWTVTALIVLILIVILCCCVCCCCCCCYLCPCCPFAHHFKTNKARKRKEELEIPRIKESHVLEFLPSPTVYKHDGLSVENISD